MRSNICTSNIYFLSKLSIYKIYYTLINFAWVKLTHYGDKNFLLIVFFYSLDSNLKYYLRRINIEFVKPTKRWFTYIMYASILNVQDIFNLETVIMYK